jgi:hypothetical protein
MKLLSSLHLLFLFFSSSLSSSLLFSFESCFLQINVRLKRKNQTYFLTCDLEEKLGELKSRLAQIIDTDAANVRVRLSSVLSILPGVHPSLLFFFFW